MATAAAPIRASKPAHAQPDRLRRFTPQRRRRASRAYSAWVAMLRWLVPLVVVGLILAVFGWSEIDQRLNPVPDTPPIAITTEPDSVVRDPRYIGTDAADRPFSLFGSAAQGDGSLDTSETINMDNPDGEITLEDGTWLAVRAAHGRLNQRDQLLSLMGAVEIFRDDGTMVETDEVHVDLETQDAWGDEPIRVRTPGLEVVAQGFRVENGGEAVVFLGQSALVLRPNSEPIEVTR